MLLRVICNLYSNYTLFVLILLLLFFINSLSLGHHCDVLHVLIRYEKKVRRLQQLGLTNKSLFSLDQWEMSRDKVVLNRKLGEGAFGMVYGGEARINVSSNIGSVDSTNKLESNEDSKDSSCHQLVCRVLAAPSNIRAASAYIFLKQISKKMTHNVS